jgi:toxin ParE1/3/4
MRVVRLPQALTDLVEIGEYIAQDNIEVADRFFDAFDETIERLRNSPKIGSPRKYRNDVPVRMWFIRGFEKCLVFYTECSDEIVILRIIHSARDYTGFIGEQ